MKFSRALRSLCIAASLTALTACVSETTPKHLRPLSFATLQEMQDLGMDKEDPILLRIFKQESELEIWKRSADGRYRHFKTYDICSWSGKLGPKKREGDRQAPEGFYTVTPAQMNPNSSYHLSFNLGYPNAFDKAYGRTGSHLMVHGACSSAGCYAMTDEIIQEVYTLARLAFRGGQREFHVHAMPFRMTPQNLALHKDDRNMPFWRNLKEGSDHFEVTGKPPKIDVCGRRYVFNASPANPRARLNPASRCPALEVPDGIEVAVAKKQEADKQAYQVALAEMREVKEAEKAAEQAREIQVAQGQVRKELAPEPFEGVVKGISKLTSFGRDADEGPVDLGNQEEPEKDPDETASLSGSQFAFGFSSAPIPLRPSIFSRRAMAYRSPATRWATLSADLAVQSAAQTL